tara:strand:- start:3341 stop:4657 length:1317 start_codon:yes stop_codon:yes gene_type:complete
MTGTILRVERGRPTGGEFAAHERQEASIELSVEPAEESASPVLSYDIPYENVHLVMSKIEKANKRLERAGVEARFTVESEPVTKEVDGIDYEFTRMTLNEPQLGFEGWTFTGAHQRTADGHILSFGENAPEVTDVRCDHCGKNRRRESVYTLHSETEGDMQVGKSCLSAFLGIKPEGLWALERPIELDEFEQPDDPDWSPSPSSRVFDAQELIVAALAASADGQEFTSRNAATSKDPATADTVLLGFEELSQLETPERVARAQEILKWVSEIPEDEDSDYLSNLRTVIGGERRIVKAKHVPLAVSAISAIEYERLRAEAEAARALRESQKVRAYLAAPKEKIEDLDATVISTNTFPGVHYNTYTTLVKLRGKDGHLITWFASGIKDYEEGSTVKVKGTVKANEIYNDDYQTVLTRAKITDPETGNVLGDPLDRFIESD